MLAKITALGNTGYQAQEIYLTSVVESCIINFDMTDVVVGCYTTEEYIFFQIMFGEILNKFMFQEFVND